MIIIQPKSLVLGVLFLVIILIGYRLHHLEKPYPTGLFTLHKLLSLGVLVYLVRWVMTVDAAPFSASIWSLVLIGGGIWLFTVISGGLLSLPKDWSVWLSRIHHVLAYGTVLVSAWSIYSIPAGK